MALANVRLQPPDPFDFKQPDNWTRWLDRFEQFRVASGLDKEDEPKQVSRLLYCAGEEAADVLASTGISADNRKKYGTVVEKFNAYFEVRKNVIFERARFNKRNQLEGESIEQYITVLYGLVEKCEFRDFKEELLRDRIVVGIRDKALSDRMQMDPDLTLEKVKKATRQREAISEQGQQLRGDGSRHAPIVTEQVKVTPTKNPQSKRRDRGRSLSSGGGSSSGTTKPKCTRCGKPKHDRGARCPAKDATCHKCNRKGHYSNQCFSKTVAAAGATDELSSDTAFLGSMGANTQSPWTAEILLNQVKVSFKLDTGAEVTAISDDTY